MRISGVTLQVIGDEFGITRERVRQIYIKTVRTFPLLREDYYRKPYEFFNLSPKDFLEMFPECNKTGVEYLSVRYIKGKKELTSRRLCKYQGPYKDELRKLLEKKKAEEDIKKTDYYLQRKRWNAIRKNFWTKQ